MNKEAQAIVLRGYIDELMKVAMVTKGLTTNPFKKKVPAWMKQTKKPEIKTAAMAQGTTAWAKNIASKGSTMFGDNMFGSGKPPAKIKSNLTKGVLGSAKAPGSAATSKALKGTESSKPATTGTDK